MKIKAVMFDIFKILLGIVMVSPLILALLVSFMPKSDIMASPLEITLANATFQNYIEGFQYLNLGTYLKNSFVMLIIILPCQLITALAAAYGFSHFNFPGKNVLFAVLLSVMMIPGEVIQITLFKMIVKWRLIDTYAGLTLPSLVGVSAVFLFRQYMQTVPKELREAALIDGCGDIKYFIQILTPLCKTMIVTFSLRAFVNIYNSYMWPYLVTTKDALRTVQTGVAQISMNNHGGITLAAATITSIIPLVVYFFGMDQIVEGMTAGAVKS
ncbi:MAG: carbohydrate ABC transporter permease [Tyzzerella sp.]|nr:carbohydrate ABC transporter permease [Tyzzerella sp.]